MKPLVRRGFADSRQPDNCSMPVAHPVSVPSQAVWSHDESTEPEAGGLERWTNHMRGHGC